MSPLPSATPETVVWEGRSSQWLNFWPFLLCILILPIPYALYRWLDTRCTTYTLTTQRLKLARGILSKTFDNLELYRVKDSTLHQPFIERLVGLGTITLITSDATNPTLTIRAIADSQRVHDAIRNEVERVRRERGVRELDVHDDDPHGALR
ncbi:MAG: PH domain-containing protein [Phycisphaerales bacterium]|nr:PH domain-containing protein [Phycisphaerales bacterium]